MRMAANTTGTMSELNTTDPTMSGLNTTDPTMSELNTTDPPWSGLSYVGLAVVIVLGVVGNTLAAAVMLRPRFRKLSASVYLLVLAAADTGCLLLNHKVQYWMKKDLGVSLFSVPWLCRVYMWLTLSVPFISSWLIVLVTLERVVIVCRPLQAKCVCTCRHAWSASTGMAGLVLLGNVFVLFIGTPDQCDLDPVRTRIVTIVAIIMYSCLPFLIIVVCNIAICVQLLLQRTHIVSECPDSSQVHRDTRRLTFMLVVNSGVFIVLTLPYNAILAYKQVGGDAPSWAVVTSEYLVCVNHAANFLLYTATGSLYRRELFALCRGRSRKRSTLRKVSSEEVEMTTEMAS